MINTTTEKIHFFLSFLVFLDVSVFPLQIDHFEKCVLFYSHAIDNWIYEHIDAYILCLLLSRNY